MKQGERFLSKTIKIDKILVEPRELSLNALAMKCIEMTLSKEAADWWKQFSFKHWPVNKATISKWYTSFKKTGKIYTLGSHLTGKKLEGPKLHERGIFKSLQLEFEEQVRSVSEK